MDPLTFAVLVVVGGAVALFLFPSTLAEVGVLTFPVSPVDAGTRVSQPFKAGVKGADGKFVGRHNGIDFAVPVGTLLFNVAPGVVKVAHNVDDNASGKHVIIQGTGEFSSLQWGYAHMSEIDVVVGQTLDPAQPIGLSGNSGLSTGPHLHFTVTPIATGFSEDPAPFLVGAV